MVKDLKFAFACQSKTKTIRRRDEEFYKEDKYGDKYDKYDKYDGCPPQYSADFNTIY